MVRHTDAPPTPPHDHMEASSAYPSLAAILASASGILATKYLAGSALAIALYDHIITFDDEVAYIWRDWDIRLSKAVYVYLRYGTELPLLYVAYVLSGFGKHLNDKVCSQYGGALCIFVILYPALAHPYMTYRHYSLWDHGKKAMVALTICTYVPVAVMGFIVMVYDFHETTFEPLLNTCLIINQPVRLVVACWGCMCAFDFCTILLTIVNSLHQPYRHHSEALTNLKRDGAIFFIGIFLIRVANMVLYIMLPPLDQFLGVLYALICLRKRPNTLTIRRTTQLFLDIDVRHTLKAASARRSNEERTARRDQDLGPWDEPA